MSRTAGSAFDSKATASVSAELPAVGYLERSAMKTFLLIVVCFCLAVPAGFSKSREFEIEFSPAFMPASSIKIVDAGTAGTLRLEDKEFVLTEPQTQRLFERFDSSLAKLSPTKSKTGLDGIRVKLRYSVADKLLFSNDIWSPTRGPEVSAIQTVFIILEELDLPLPHREYFERLLSYFDFALPWRLIIGDSITIRFHSILSASHAFELHRLFNSIPPESPVIIDMTNFQGMGTMFYDDFQRFNATHNVEKWLVSETTLELLRRIGISAQKIEVREQSQTP